MASKQSKGRTSHTEQPTHTAVVLPRHLFSFFLFSIIDRWRASAYIYKDYLLSPLLQEKGFMPRSMAHQRPCTRPTSYPPPSFSSTSTFRRQFDLISSNPRTISLHITPHFLSFSISLHHAQHGLSHGYTHAFTHSRIHTLSHPSPSLTPSITSQSNRVFFPRGG